MQILPDAGSPRLGSEKVLLLKSHGHFDLYRLKDADAFMAMGFEEYFFTDGLTCIEWAERIASVLPPDAIHLHLSHRADGSRDITPRDS